MPEVLIDKHHLVGSGYAEMPMNGRRYRFHVERYRHDDGSEWGRIIDVQEIPDVGPYLYIPSYGVEASEMQYMAEEWEHEKTHPDPIEAEWWAGHRSTAARKLAVYNEAREERAKHIRRNPVTHGRG